MTIHKKTDMISVAKKQLSLDLGCSPELFDSAENSIVISRLMEGRRQFSRENYFFHMATFGHGTVISADEKLNDWCVKHLKDHEGIRLFEHYMMLLIENEMRKYGRKLSVSVNITCRCRALFIKGTTSVSFDGMVRNRPDSPAL